MSLQLPDGAHAAAAGVLFYTIVALILNSLLIWLVWVHRERLTHVALLSYFTFLSTTICLVSQIYEYVRYRDIVADQWKSIHDNPNTAELQASNGAVGTIKALWYFQLYAYSAESMFVMFWAFSLAQAVYGLYRKTNLVGKVVRWMDPIGKVISVLLPVLPVSLLQLDKVQSCNPAFIFLANFILMFSLFIAAACLIAIADRYLYCRKRLLQFTLDAHPLGSAAPPPHGVYDRWLLVRFAIAFVSLVIYEVVHVYFQMSGRVYTSPGAGNSSPDFGAERARNSVILYMAGSAPSYMQFIIFGTTTEYRQYMYRTFIPRWCQVRIERFAQRHFKRKGSKKEERKDESKRPRSHKRSMTWPANVSSSTGQSPPTRSVRFGSDASSTLPYSVKEIEMSEMVYINGKAINNSSSTITASSINKPLPAVPMHSARVKPLKFQQSRRYSWSLPPHMQHPQQQQQQPQQHAGFYGGTHSSSNAQRHHHHRRGNYSAGDERMFMYSHSAGRRPSAPAITTTTRATTSPTPPPISRLPPRSCSAEPFVRRPPPRSYSADAAAAEAYMNRGDDEDEDQYRDQHPRRGSAAAAGSGHGAASGGHLPIMLVLQPEELSRMRRVSPVDMI